MILKVKWWNLKRQKVIIHLMILEPMGEASKQELMNVLEKALPDVLSKEQKSKKVSNLLQAMKREGLIVIKGKNKYAKWRLLKNNEGVK